MGAAWIEIEIKLMLIMGREITFAGSTLLKDEFVKTLFNRNIDFFREGLIIPDLTSSAAGFEERLIQYPGRAPNEEKRRHACRLDENIRHVITFDSKDVSSSYVHDLIGYLENRIHEESSGPVAERMAQLISEIRKTDGPLSLRRVSDLCRLIPEWQQVNKMGEFLYCCTGAEIVGADALYSKHYKDAQVQFGLVEGVSQPNLELAAAECLFGFFAIDWRKLAVLGPADVLKLRDDSRIRYGVEALQKLVQDVREKALVRSVGSDARGAIEDAAEELRAAVEEACARQAKREAILSSTSDAIFDASGIPFSSLARKGVAKLEGWFAKSKTFGGAARPLTPLTSFASLIHEELKGKHD